MRWKFSGGRFATLLMVVYSLFSLNFHFKMIKKNTVVFYLLRECRNKDALTALKSVSF